MGHVILHMSHGFLPGMTISRKFAAGCLSVVLATGLSVATGSPGYAEPVPPPAAGVPHSQGLTTQPSDRVVDLPADPSTPVGPIPPAGAPPAAPAVRASAACSGDELYKLGPAEMVAYLEDPAITGDGCLSKVLWGGGNAADVLATSEHMLAAAGKLKAIAGAYDGSNARHAYELWYYVHWAEYQDEYKDSVTLDDAARSAISEAVVAFGDNPNLFKGGSEAGVILREMTISMDTPAVRVPVLGVAVKILRHVAETPAAWNDFYRRLGANNILFYAFRGAGWDPLFQAAITADPAIVDAELALAKANGMYAIADARYVIDNAVGEYGRMGVYVPALKSRVLAGWGDLGAFVKTNYGETSPAWFNFGTWSEELGVCEQYGVCDLRGQFEKRLLPNTFTYDDGDMVFHTAISKAKADQLYYALKQVKAQLFRTMGSDDPLPGDDHPVITMRIFGKMSDYRTFMGPLYNIDGCCSGGMFIEGNATFYTYDRTVPTESIYSLEELTRHEYTHYLQSRWQEHGSFGEPPWYGPECRTTAWDEGSAEFFAGATRANGVQIRNTMVQALAGDRNLTVKETINFCYKEPMEWDFYANTWALLALLDQRHPSVLTKLTTLLRNNDVSGWDVYRSQISNDAALETEYQAFKTDLISKLGTFPTPKTTFISPASLSTGDVKVVQRKARTQTLGLGFLCKKSAAGAMPRFLCDVPLNVTTKPSDPDKVAFDLRARVDRILRDFNRSFTNNLHDTNCWYDAPQAAGGSQVKINVTCEGPLKPS